MSDHDRTPSQAQREGQGEGGSESPKGATRRVGGKRQPLSCLACRKHKLRCDRRVPCGTCVRYRREAQCRQNPAPQRSVTRRSRPSARPQPAEISPASSAPKGGSLNPGTEGGTGDEEDGPDDPRFVTPHGLRASIGLPHVQQDYQQLPSSCSVSDGLSLLAIFDMERTSWSSLPQLLARAERKDKPSSSSWRAMIDTQFRRRASQQQLSSVLPSRPQCDLLLNFYLEHINWIFQTVHVPSFRREYARFWDVGMDKADFIWTSLLFTVISVSALYIPLEAVDVVGFPRASIRNLAHIWHLASSHALRAGDYEGKPCLVQLQTFSITMLYWYATNQIEVMNSRLGQAVRTAQAIRLDSDTAPSKSLREEMRHRIWWDLVDSDMFQTVCLDRPPLIKLRSPGVPLPLNCNDSDLTEHSVHPRLIEEPTEMSMNIFRARLFQILNLHFFANDDKDTSSGTDPRPSYQCILSLDSQILDLMSKLPWYFQLDQDGRPPLLPEPLDERLTWQHHILRTCISTQRIRMYRQHLHPRTGSAWSNCISAAQDSLVIYRSLRSNTTQTSRHKFLPQAYQIFSVAVTVVALLLVEGSLPIPDVYQQVWDMASDLGMLERQGGQVPVATHGRQVLEKMLALCEARATSRSSTSPEEAQSLVPDIAIILGGEPTARNYMSRLHYPPISQAEPTDGAGHEESRAPGNADARPEQTKRWDEIHGEAGAGAGLSPQLSHLAFSDGSLHMDLDPDLFIEERMGLLNWDMTGLLMLDSN